MFKKLSLSLMVVALVAMLVSAATFALFTAQTTNVDNTFTAGTVSLGAPADALINIENLAPGDTNISAGSFTVTYMGSLEAWLGLDAATEGALFAGAYPATITITDGVNFYSANANDQVVGLFNSGESVTFSVTASMPLLADNSYQGATGSLTMSVKAVQARNNTNESGTGPISW